MISFPSSSSSSSFKRMVLRWMDRHTWGINNISILKQPQFFQSLKNPIDKFINSLQSPQSQPIKFIIIFHHTLILPTQSLYPGRTARYIWIEIPCPRYLHISKKVFVSLRRNRRRERRRSIRMRCNRSRNKEKRFFLLRRLFQKPVCFIGDEISGVSAIVKDGRIFVILKCGILVIICVWIEEEVGWCETIYIWRIVICGVMVVE